MPAKTYAVEPIEPLLLEADPERSLAACGIQRLILGSEALSVVAETVAELLGGRQPSGAGEEETAAVALLVDPVRISRRGEDVKDLMEEQLGRRFPVTRTVLDDGHSELHVVDHILDEASAAVVGKAAVVAVGGGTISDIAKVAVQRASARGAGPVLVTVQTAASVDGYTDDVSVVLRDGVKRTVPSRWPEAVVADTDVISEAPEKMNRAGFGEMTSMFTAPADWRLASMVGADRSYNPSAVRLLASVVPDLESCSDGLREGRPDAVAALTRALALRGIVTGVAGTSAVLSGVEHLISHMLDQYHSGHGRPIGLHGAQVGAGAVIAASAWDMLFDRLADRQAPQIAPIETALDPERGRRKVLAAFERVDSSLKVAEECWSDYSAKLEAVAWEFHRVRDLVGNWAEHQDELRSLVRPPGEIASALSRAGAPARLSDLGQHVDPELQQWAVANCALMRNRFTVVDLLALLGWWEPGDVGEVLERAHQAVAAAEGQG
ncbi:iron-containing alcohol dehydrogenase [Sinomonas terrae]|uniref:Iron-containing alcohol dehydrogenase n=1 Tax=Sinomonas terrae TaxID=2908838 RepID=A0ABS9U7I4_9MICC|nr:iron-containing alcohol dehydrogenase [Sinomonas terrae]MCH6472560.1 iron-containing alcohol dehydrogenase [Sinomonas terrae]